MLHLIEHTLLDSLKLVPFLFLTYLLMEYLEHKTGQKLQKSIQKAGRFGPMIGGILGAVPQCGFSAAASGFYAGKVITPGTLLAVFLSTSDEMLPVMISERAETGLILKILLLKVVIGAAAGFLVDLLVYRKEEKEPDHIHEICEQEHCHCEKGIFHSALLHTAQITGFIILITFGLNLILEAADAGFWQSFLQTRPILGSVLAGLVGLIPNCAASVAITQLYLQGVISFGAMMAGLLTGAGAGLLVLFRANHNRKENVRILLFLYGIGVLAGIVMEFIGL